MQLLLWSVIIIFGIAVLIDKVMTEEGLRTWRDSTRELREKVDELEIDVATTAANGLFRSLFDAIYDKHFWSKRRFVRSYLSSLLALSVITLLLDWEITHFGMAYRSSSMLGYGYLFLVVCIINTCADYFSLQETRWILGRSREATFAKLCGWAIVDLVATAGIYLFIFFIAANIIDAIFGGPGVGILRFLGDIVDIFSRKNAGLPFFLSTFFTSALWFLFIASALVIRAMKRGSRVLRISLDTIGESHAPARTTAGIMAIVLIVGYGVAQALTWATGF